MCELKKNPVRIAGKTRTRLIAAIVLNLLIVVLELKTWLPALFAGETKLYVYYTQDSNIFALFAALCAAVFETRLLFGDKAVPKAAAFIKYAAVCCVTVTFLVVVFVLAPMSDWPHPYKALLFSGDSLWLHTVCPLLSLTGFVFTETGFELPKRAPLLALIPTVVYGVILIVLNLSRSVVGPYPFLRVYDQPVWASCLWAAVIFGGAYGIAWGIGRIARRK